jgi:hypothetical protein
VLVSALVFGSKNLTRLIEKVSEEHTLVLCSHIIDEFHDVVARKSGKYSHVANILFSRLSYELVYTPDWQDSMPEMRDACDKPILAAAILADEPER